MIFQSVISDYDVFFAGEIPPETTEQRVENGVMRMEKRNGASVPVSFFSTDPFAYLKPENQITQFYQ